MAVIESSIAVDVKAQTRWGWIQQRHCAIGAEGVGAAHGAARGGRPHRQEDLQVFAAVQHNARAPRARVHTKIYMYDVHEAVSTSLPVSCCKVSAATSTMTVMQGSSVR